MQMLFCVTWVHACIPNATGEALLLSTHRVQCHWDVFSQLLLQFVTAVKAHQGTEWQTMNLRPWHCDCHICTKCTSGNGQRVHGKHGTRVAYFNCMWDWDVRTSRICRWTSLANVHLNDNGIKYWLMSLFIDSACLHLPAKGSFQCKVIIQCSTSFH